MYKILIVDDDRVIADTVKEQLIKWGYEARIVDDFNNVLKIFAEYGPHLVLMDIGLPFFNGYHWCAQIRNISKVPVIFMSSMSDNMNIVMAINMGGDDFVIKPFDMNVLIAKVQAMLRRTYSFAESTNIIEHNGCILNMNDQTFIYNEEMVELTKNEYRILQCLLENIGKVVARDTIMMKLWESDNFIDDNTLTVNVARLRKKLENAGLNDYIKTKKGSGYIII
jgi:two-component system response regulator protein BraR/BceR